MRVAGLGFKRGDEGSAPAAAQVVVPGGGTGGASSGGCGRHLPLSPVLLGGAVPAPTVRGQRLHAGGGQRRVVMSATAARGADA